MREGLAGIVRRAHGFRIGRTGPLAEGPVRARRMTDRVSPRPGWLATNGRPTGLACVPVPLLPEGRAAKASRRATWGGGRTVRIAPRRRARARPLRRARSRPANAKAREAGSPLLPCGLRDVVPRVAACSSVLIA